MKKILLVAPVPLRFELTQDDHYRSLPFSRVKSFMVPLHIATVAALTPEEYEVRLWDESVQGPAEQAQDLSGYDLVGITAYTAHLPRAREIARAVRNMGIPVVIGGAGISTAPQRYYEDFDTIFIGETERTWPRFLCDWKRGKPSKVYRQFNPVDLAQSPCPRWDSIRNHLKHYLLGGVQTSRGCPFDCEFCDVSYLFGRRFRHKKIDQVLEELSTLERHGLWKIVFCDDNFAGNPGYTKDLLREIISLNKSLHRPLGFATEASINIATDEELLELLADANFVEIFIGIESPNKESLKETNKLQNYRSNLIEDIKKIQSYGLCVRGSLIVGFDHDEKDIFQQHLSFVQESFLTIPSLRVLMAPPGTRLWKRLQREGRLLKTETEGRYYGNPGTTNIVPKNMTRQELHVGYLDLIEKIYAWDSFAVRLKGFIAGVKRRPKVAGGMAQWTRLIPFAAFLLRRLDKRSRAIVLDILVYTVKRAPYMLPRIGGFIMRQYGYAERPELWNSIRSVIQQEREGEGTLPIAEYKPLLPEGFREVYADVFPKVHRELSNAFSEEEVENEFVDLLVEVISKAGSEGFSREKAGDIFAAARKRTNGRGEILQKNECPGLEAPKGIARSDRKYLDEQILKAVEQELAILTGRAGQQGAGRPGA